MTGLNRFTIMLLSCFLVIAFSGIIGAYSISSSLGAPLEIIGDNIGLRVEPAEGRLFSVENLYPGKTESKTVTVSNTGDNPFNLDISLAVSGDTELIEALWLVISAPGDVTYYEGPLELAVADLGQISDGSGVDLLFQLTLLTGRGNVTQAKSAEMLWTFAAAAITPGPPPVPDPPPPPPPAEPEVVLIFAPEAPETRPLERLDPPVEDTAEIAPEEPAVVPSAEPPETEVAIILPEAPQMMPAVGGRGALTTIYYLSLLALITVFAWQKAKREISQK